MTGSMLYFCCLEVSLERKRWGKQEISFFDFDSSQREIAYLFIFNAIAYAQVRVIMAFRFI
jgi:hypothetical protein